jgi:hypothetical protein
MRGVVRSLWSPDIPGGRLGDFAPSDPLDFGLLVEASIGPAGAAGEEVFDIVACSPSWLAARPGKGFTWGRGTLLMARWDPAVVERAIGDLCLRSEGEEWQAVARLLGGFMRSEFADFLDR